MPAPRRLNFGLNEEADQAFLGPGAGIALVVLARESLNDDVELFRRDDVGQPGNCGQKDEETGDSGQCTIGTKNDSGNYPAKNGYG